MSTGLAIDNLGFTVFVIGNSISKVAKHISTRDPGGRAVGRSWHYAM